MIQRLAMAMRPNSYDPQTRTFSVVAATNAPVDRGDFIEIIDLQAMFAGGFPGSIPLQVDHSPSVRDTIGKLFNFRFEELANGFLALIADALLSTRSDNAAIEANLQTGIQEGFSIGAMISKWKTGKGPEGKKVKTAVAGKLIEGSLVIAPADPNSTIRNLAMPNNQSQTTNTNEEIDDAMTVEQLRTLARAAGVTTDVIDRVVATDAPTPAKMQAMLATLNSRSVVPSAGNDVLGAETLDNPAVLRRAAVEAFDAINRNEAPTGLAAGVFADGEAALAKRILRAAGQDVAGISDQVALRRAATTSDYAIIAGQTFNLSMRREYDGLASSISALFGTSTVASFNAEKAGLVDWTSLEIGKKLENGNYRYSYVDESGETIFVETLGGITGISRELSINAAGKLGDMGQKFGKRLAADAAERQVAFLEQASMAGPTMADGNPVFHATRSNIEEFELSASGAGGPYIFQVMDFRARMAQRKGAGNVMIGTYPTHWMVHSEFEGRAYQLVAEVQASAVGDVNPLAGKLKIVVEPRLSDVDTSWLVAEPAKMDGATRVLLRGFEAPFTDSRQSFENDNIEFKVRHDFGLGWLEWRSWTRLDHVTLT